MRTKRRAYRTATHVVMVLAEIWRLGNTELPTGVDPADRRALSRHLFTELDHVLGDGDRSTDRALLRLFHPEQGDSAAGHQSAWHAKDRNLTLQVTPPNTRAAKRIGWLAHFNAACALSVAIKLPPESRPWDCEDDEWAMDCAAGALRQLAKVLRHPYSRLDPSWLRYDPDLEPLKELLHRLPRDHVFVELAATIGLPGPTPPELV